MYAVQRFWFLRAWNWITALSNANWRFGLHAGLIALAAALLAMLLDPMLGHGVSRILDRLSLGGVSVGKSFTTFARLWLVASFFGFLAVESWKRLSGSRMLRRGCCVILERLRVGSARRAAHFFNMRPLLPEAFPFLPLPMGLPPGV